MAATYYCPRCGLAALDTVDNKLYGCTDCGYTYFHNTAAAVAAVIARGEEIALITRANEPGRGLLDLPGGFVEGDESLETAVIREVREEIGLELRRPRYLFSIPNRYEYHGIRYRTVDVFFGFEVDRIPPFVPNEEAAALHWMRVQDIDLQRVAFESVRGALCRLDEVRKPAA
ncbi:MAG TPA: NUDIX domain-containing protein [Gammaproteobacteria bacterium]|nr:NUDIX domain-containing protein [Gammaproteobacteria bacterium]